jgi:hypothetical protein
LANRAGTDDDVPSAAVLAVLARVYMRLNESELSVAAADRALVVAEHADAQPIIVEALVNKGTSYTALGRRLEGRALMRTAVDLAERLELYEPQLRALNNLSSSILEDDPKQAVEMILESVKLAERTGQATQQITGMIGAIQADTGAAVDSMHEVTPQVAVGVDMAGQAAAALREINAGAAATLDKVRDVASATSEQSHASASVAQNVERIAQMVEESAESVRAANTNVRSLEALAGELRASVTRFRL